MYFSSIFQDPGISNTQPEGSYLPYDIGLEMGVFVNDSSGVPIVGKVCILISAFFHFASAGDVN